MKHLPLLLVLLLAPASLSAQDAQEQARADTMSRLSGTVEHELARSIETLNSLQQRIAAEKLPLAQDLTASEERVTELRREHDRVARRVDAGNLELTTIRGEMKARQDELDYVGNLLDEYARGFESKVNVCELQYCGEANLAAKQAAENDTLAPAEKFARQLAFADVSLERLFQAVGGLRFPGIGVDLEGNVAKGQFAIVGPVALFSASGGAAGIVVPQSGSSNPLIRPLEGAMQAGLVALVEKGDGLVPLDPSRGGALRALVKKFSLVHEFEKGGPIMWPMLLASIVALGAVLERLLFLMNEKRKRDPGAREDLFAEVERGNLEAAIAIGRQSKDFVVRAMTYALAHREKSIANALLYAQTQELKRYKRGTAVLDTVITLAPLLGLLGTIVGMMNSFSAIGGELSAPGAITGGIAEALIATACGLGIAILCLLPFNWLNAKQEQARIELDSASAQLELLLKSPALAHAVAEADASLELAARE